MEYADRKLYLEKDNRVEAAKIYTAQSDLLEGLPALHPEIDGKEYFVQLDYVGEANATCGYVRIGNNTYQICSSAYIPIGYYASYGEMAGTANNTWDNVTTDNIICQSARTVTVSFSASWYNADRFGESNIRLVINGAAVITWTGDGAQTNSNTATAKVAIPAGDISIAIQYYKPKWTRWILVNATINIES